MTQKYTDVTLCFKKCNAKKKMQIIGKIEIGLYFIAVFL